MGRKRKPSIMNQLEGFPGKRKPQPEIKPEIPETIPAPPLHLSAEAQKEWRSIAPKLHRLGLLSELDIPALTLYCAAVSRWILAEQALKKTGSLVKTSDGKVVPSPFLSLARTNAKLALQILVGFGMTPRSAILRRCE